MRSEESGNIDRVDPKGTKGREKIRGIKELIGQEMRELARQENLG